MDFSELDSSSGNMLSSYVHCKTSQTCVKSEIISILKQNPLNASSSQAILIGSKAARHYLPNFRGITEGKNADWDLISSSSYLLEWLHRKDEDLDTIKMIIPTSDDDEPLDLYVYCTLHDGSKYDFAIPRSSESYTAYILNNLVDWIRDDRWGILRDEGTDLNCTATAKLLLILKKYMLYYSHQWEKTAKDYYQLLAVVSSLTDKDMILCDLFIRYNEKLHGKRPLDTNQFIINPTDTREGMIITQDEFFRLQNDQQISLIHQAAMLLSIAGDILIGLEYICTQGPQWLADYAIENWILIHREKFKQKFQLTRPCIQFELDNYRLFPNIPEIATERILHFITNAGDFHSMQFVCKRWYTILREEIFWRDLYLSRYGAYSGQVDNIKSWKILYFVRLEGNCNNNSNKLEELVDATIRLRQFTANHILHLWEDLTYENQSIGSVLFSRVNYVLSNSFYYEIEKTSDDYSVRLILFGLEHEHSQSNVYLKLWMGEYGSSRFTTHMEQLSIQCNSYGNQQRSLTFFGPHLFGFYLGKWGYISKTSTLLSQNINTITDPYPSGLLVCLFTMMVHPEHRAQFIKYLKTLKNRSLSELSYMGY